jgi:hypothetical protein
MSRLTNIQKDEQLLKVIKLAIHEFKQEHNVTDLYFANKLHFKGDTAVQQFGNFLQQFNKKYLKADELLILIDCLGTHKKIILDYLCSRSDYICSTSAQSQKEDDIQNIFMDIADITGDISKAVKEAKKDGKIDSSEKKIIDSYLYELRSKIKGYENA